MKKSLRPARRRELAQWFHGTFQVNCARAWRRPSLAAPRGMEESGQESDGPAAAHS